MTYQIYKGVEPPAKPIKRGGYYDKMMEAIEQLEVNDPCAVKIVFDDEKQVNRAAAKIYGDNKKHPDWRYTVQLAPSEKAVYVMKVAEQPTYTPRKNGSRPHLVRTT